MARSTMVWLKRRLFTILSALSLLLFVAVLVMWVRSYWQCDAVAGAIAGAPAEAGHYYSLSTYRGRLLLLWLEAPVTGTGLGFDSKPITPQTYVFDLEPGRHFAGFQYRPRPRPVPHVVGFAGVPLWSVLVLLAVAPAIRLLRRRRPRPGLCPACGYDLRATPGRCPECGAVPDSAGVEKLGR